MRKKILFVITKSNFGGAQRYVYDLATNLPKDQFDVSVAFGPAPDGKAGRLSRMLVEQNIRTICIDELSRDVSLFSDWRAFRALMGLFLSEKPDIVHLNSSKAGGLGSLAARLCGVSRIVFTSHGLPYDEDRSFLARILIMIATWCTVIFSHRTIVVSKDSLHKLRRLPFLYHRVTLIHNGIQPIAFEAPADARKALRSIDPTIPETALVGCVAELHPNKDLVVALDAIVHVPEGHLVIIGDGELRAPLETYARESKIHDRVHFLGYIPEAAKYLRAFDMFLMTSRKEGLPYVLLEAGSAHVPVLAVDIPGVRDIVVDNFTGLLAPRDGAAIAVLIKRLCTVGALSRSLTDEMQTRMLKTFSFSTMIDRSIVQYLT